MLFEISIRHAGNVPLESRVTRITYRDYHLFQQIMAFFVSYSTRNITTEILKLYALHEILVRGTQRVPFNIVSALRLARNRCNV